MQSVTLIIDKRLELSTKYKKLLESKTNKVTITKNLTDDDKEFIINNFFDANYHSMILPNPEYNRLYQKYQG